MQVLRAADRIAVSWKNGGGVTRDVVVSPAGAGIDEFDWRISIADVAAGGPFSAFPGIDRILTVIEGAGLSLSIDGRAAVVLGEGSPPLALSGDARCDAGLRQGPIRDLNVMVRRGAYRAHVRRRSLDAGDIFVGRGEVTLLLVLEATTASWPGGEAVLAREDALLAPAGARVTFGAAVRLVVGQIDPA